MKLAALCIATFGTACATGADKPASVAATGSKSIVVVELFTSQGCSSCPPADAWLSELGAAGAIEGVDVVPLAYHVDYWNDLGWADPYSSAEWSRRQRRYAEALREGRVYTPQMVVDGREHVVGSKRAAIARAVRRAADRDVIPVDVVLDVGAGDAVARIGVGLTLDEPLGSGRLVARVAVFESGLETAVPRGENAGRALHNDYIVRALTDVAHVDVGARDGAGSAEVALDPAWEHDALGVVAFVQDTTTLEIVAATAPRALFAPSPSAP